MILLVWRNPALSSLLGTRPTARYQGIVVVVPVIFLVAVFPECRRGPCSYYLVFKVRPHPSCPEVEDGLEPLDGSKSVGETLGCAPFSSTVAVVPDANSSHLMFSLASLFSSFLDAVLYGLGTGRELSFCFRLYGDGRGTVEGGGVILDTMCLHARLIRVGTAAIALRLS